MSTRRRVAALALLIAAAVVAFVIASSSGDDDSSGDKTAGSAATTNTTSGGTTAPPAAPPKPDVTRIRVQNGKPVGGVRRIKVDKGDRVRLAVTSDVADEVHLHGYDISKDVAPGTTARFNFKADIDGGFEIELEGRKEQIASLEVNP
jgi:hypothetical protein